MHGWWSLPRRNIRDFLFPGVDVVAGWHYRGRTCWQGAGGHKIPGRDAAVNHVRRPVGSEVWLPYMGGHSPWSVSFVDPRRTFRGSADQDLRDVWEKNVLINGRRTVLPHCGHAALALSCALMERVMLTSRRQLSQ